MSSGGLHQTGKDAVGFQPAFRSGSEAYLAEDHQMSERLFRVIVRRRYPGAPEEGKEKFLLGACEIGPEGLGGFEAKRLFVGNGDAAVGNGDAAEIMKFLGSPPLCSHSPIQSSPPSKPISIPRTA